MKRALTKSQAAELLTAAGLLPLTSRDQFITAVDKRLRSVKRPLTDADVSAAIVSTLNVTTSHFMCDAAEGNPAMAKKWEIYDLHGNRRIEEEDDDGVLKPNRILRVPMMMRDGMSEIQKSVADAKMARDAAQQFGLSDALDLHKPGQRFCVDATARGHVEEVYQDEKRKLQDAWRTPVARGQQEGDVCTVREGGVAEGSPGHLRMVNGKLTCVPERRHQDAAPRGPTYDAAEGERIKAAAYAAMVDELQNCWRQPVAAPPSVEPRAKATDAERTVPRSMSVDAARAICDAAYEQSVRELTDAWKGPPR